MSASCWNKGQIAARRQNLQTKEEVPHRDIDVGNGRESSGILNIMDNLIYFLYANCCARTRNYMQLT